MYEVTLFDGGIEVGTFDMAWPVEANDLTVTHVRTVDHTNRTAQVDIEYI